MEHRPHQNHQHKHKNKNHYYLIIGTIICIVAAGIYVWRKYKNPMICREICFSTSDEQNCATVCIDKSEIKG